MYTFKEKLKLLRQTLCVWHRDSFDYISTYLNKKSDMLDDMDSQICDNLPVDLNDPKVLSSDYWKCVRLKESMLAQKSRVRWLKDGDTNSHYLCASIPERLGRNQVVALKVGDS